MSGSGLLGEGLVDLIDSGHKVGVAVEIDGPGGLGRLDLGSFVVKLTALGSQPLDVGTEGLPPKRVSLDEHGGSGLFAVPGSTPGKHPETGVAGPGRSALLVPAGGVEVVPCPSDGWVCGPSSAPGFKVGEVGVDLAGLLAESVEFVADVARDRQSELFEFGQKVGLIGGEVSLVADPLLAALLVPGPGQARSGLELVRCSEVDVAGVAGPAHGHIGELASAAVLEEMGDVDGGALGPMGGDGVAVGQTVGAEVVAGHVEVLAVGGDGGQVLGGRVDRGDLGRS
jgi:hypothetical protein